MPTSYPALDLRKLYRGLLWGVLALCFALSTQALHAAGRGVIEGRVLNASSGNYLNRARVVVKGTALETYTNDTGAYRLVGVPVGEVEVVASYVGLDQRSSTVAVTDSGVSSQDFSLSVVPVEYGADGKTIELEPMSVTAQALSGQAVAMTEQKNAPNVKNVISTDEFVDMADGNVGEFIKFVPGLDIQYNPFSPSSVTMRGMPASGTLVQFDGVPTAPSLVGNSRSFDLNTAANANIDRIEVSKVPTPDMPANAVGGSINVVSKSGFSRVTPLFSYNIYASYNALAGEFNPSLGKAAGPDSHATLRPVQFAYDLSYILPLNKKIAFTFAVARSPRANNSEFIQPQWNMNTGLLNSGTLIEYVSNVDLQTAKGTMDWRISNSSSVQFSYHLTDRKSIVRQNATVFTPGAGAVGDQYSIQGTAAGVGSSAQNLTANQQYRRLELGTVKYRYDGRDWKFDTSISHSIGGTDVKDMDDGLFNTAATNRTQLVVGATGLNGVYDGRIPTIVATTRTGVPADIFDGSFNSINTVTSNQTQVDNEVSSISANLGRDLNLAVPTKIKVGFYMERMMRDARGGVKTYTFNPPGGTAARLASLYDVFTPDFSQRLAFTNTEAQRVGVNYISLSKIYDLYRQNPTWFTLNQAAANLNLANASIELEEVVTAGYFRVDNKFFNNRLWIVSGLRYEQTTDDGRGPRNELGTVVERGAVKKTTYDDFFPSVNATFNITDDILVRAAYARTILRPELDDIIPSVTIVPPNADDGVGRITLVDGSLKPWASHNYDVTFEAYNIKGGTASVSFFYKDISDFFATTRSPVTPEILEEFGLPDSYSNYDVIRTRNGGDATASGYELSYRQSLGFIPNWGKRFQVFANFTSTHIDGQNPADFPEFSPKNFNAGVSYIHGRFVAKVNLNYNDWVRRSATAASAVVLADSYNMRAPATKLDLSVQYRFNKWLSIYSSIRNITAEPVRLSVVNLTPNSTQPDHTRPRNYQFVPIVYTFGVKGSF